MQVWRALLKKKLESQKTQTKEDKLMTNKSEFFMLTLSFLGEFEEFLQTRSQTVFCKNDWGSESINHSCKFPILQKWFYVGDTILSDELFSSFYVTLALYIIEEHMEQKPMYI